MSKKNLRIDGGRLLKRLSELAKRGAREDGGCNRLAFTDADKEGRDLVTGWMRELGMKVSIDAIGNGVALRPGLESGPPVMVGSHIDTVRTGGRYDGNFGVLSGLEVVETLRDGGITTRRPLAVAFFSNEEGSRVAPDMMGSLVYVGGLGLAEAHAAVTIDGKRVGEELDRIGYRGDAPVPGLVPYAYVELHIEQGPVLESLGLPLGAVLGTFGVERHRVSFRGQAAHAGSTPMAERRDALAGAAKLELEIREIAARTGGGAVCTMGGVVTRPGIPTSVVEEAVCLLDQRHLDAGSLASMLAAAKAASERFASEERIDVSWERIWGIEPIPFDETLIGFCDDAIREVTGASHRLPSGPLHDAAEVARAGIPTVMMFVQSLRGLSHTKLEDTTTEHLELAVQGLDRLATRTLEWVAGGGGR
jgi:N-carbamoyl-L-amino-acid hydrolase